MTTPSKAGADAILSATLTELETGPWTMDLEVASDDELEGTISILLSGSILLGTVVRGAVDGGSWSGRIQGGLGGIQSEIASRSYSGATVAMILADIALDATETISVEILAKVSATALALWVRPAGKASRAIADLASKLELNWRITRAGEIWIGSDTYQPVVGLDFKQLSQGASDSVTIAPQNLLVSPGDLFLTRQVSDVITSVTDEGLEQKVIFKKDSKAGMVAIVARLFDRMIGRRIDLSASYPARVVLQRGDDSLDVIVDHPRFAGEGIKGIPIRLGIPGARCEVNPGARVRIHFDQQDQSKPFAALWDTNALDVSVIEIGATAEFAARTDKVESQLEAIWSLLTTWTPVPNDGGAALKIAAGIADPTPVDTACATLKVK